MNAIATSCKNYECESKLEEIYNESNIEELIERLTRFGWSLMFNHDPIELEDSEECNSSGSSWDSCGNLEYFRLVHKDGYGIYAVLVHYEFRGMYGTFDDYTVVMIMCDEQDPTSLQEIASGLAHNCKSDLTIYSIPTVPTAQPFDPRMYEELAIGCSDHTEKDWDPVVKQEFQMLLDIFGPSIVSNIIEEMQSNSQLSYSLPTDWITSHD